MKLIMAIVMFALLISACGKQKPETPTGAESVSDHDRRFSPESLVRGARLYQEHCALCHGPEAQGHPDWSNPKVVAASPLNGTGNAWKRSKQEMIAIIKKGASRHGIAVMPGWNGRLSESDIDDIINWYQALWPPDVYDRWREATVQSALPES
jgi:mono/diheme cytochrome c family protein